MTTLKHAILALLSGAAVAGVCRAAPMTTDERLAALEKLAADQAAEITSLRQELGHAKRDAPAVVLPAASASKTIVSGKMYIDVSDITATTADGTKVNPSGDGFDVKRFYFGVTHVFNDVWSANINTDSAYSTSTGATSLFIKTAFVQAKISPALIVQAGSASMPWIPFAEDNYGFRYVENTLIDRLHFGNSADWGLHVLGTSGMVSYNIAAVNGGGYKNPTRSKSMDFEGRISIEPVKGLVFAAGLYDGKLGKDTYSAPAKRATTRYNLLAAYKNSRFRLGAEYFWESDWGYTASTQSDSGDGFSLFGDVAVGGPFSLFARYDNDKSSQKLHPSMKEDYFNTGLQWHAFTGVDVSLVYKHDKIANPASASQVTQYDEFGLFSQVAF